MTLAGYEQSYYVDSAISSRDYPALIGEVRSDVCVIGGGYTGLSAALHLAELGYSVSLLEAEKVGWGASGRNGGQVAPGHNMEHSELCHQMGHNDANALWKMSLESVALVRTLVERHQINCDLKSGVLHVAAKPAHSSELKAAVAYTQQTLNYSQCHYLSAAQVTDLLGTPHYYGGEYWPEAAHLHPLNYALGLAEAAQQAGVKIYEHSRVTCYHSQQGARVNTRHGRVLADSLVLACNGYLGNLAPHAAGKIMPVNNFILATEPLSDTLCQQINPQDLAIADSRFVVNYFRLSADKRLLWGGGETYSQRFPADIRSFVRKYMLEVYPQLGEVKIDYGWGGTLAITLNRMPCFDRQGNLLFVAQGYSGHGVALSTLAGKLIAEAINGAPERFDLFARVPSPAFPGGTLLRKPGQIAGMLYYAMRDRWL